MTLFKEPQSVTLTEFEVMEKQEGLTYELIDGVVMTFPRPNPRHSELASRLAVKLMQYFQDESCFVFFERELHHNDAVLIPDLSFFCKDNTEVPLLVIEILSPSTRSRDLIQKPYYYQKMGILEYWIIDPEEETLMVFNLAEESAITTYQKGQIVQSIVKPEIQISLDELFKRFL